MAQLGRPPLERKTEQTRAWEDQVTKLQWLYRVKGIRSADFIGPRIAADLDAEFERIRPVVEQIEAAEAENDPIPTHELGEAGA